MIRLVGGYVNFEGWGLGWKMKIFKAEFGGERKNKKLCLLKIVILPQNKL
jgi:hypothetical protein